MGFGADSEEEEEEGESDGFGDEAYEAEEGVGFLTGVGELADEP